MHTYTAAALTQSGLIWFLQHTRSVLFLPDDVFWTSMGKQTGRGIRYLQTQVAKKR